MNHVKPNRPLYHYKVCTKSAGVSGANVSLGTSPGVRGEGREGEGWGGFNPAATAGAAASAWLKNPGPAACPESGGGEGEKAASALS